MRTNRLFSYITIAAAAILPAACDAGGATPSEASVPITAAPADLSAGTIVAPTPEALTLPDQTASPHPLRAVPETFEQIAPTEPPAMPTHETEAPTDGMPVLDQPVHDVMPSVPAASTDPMPIVSPSMTSPSMTSPSMTNKAETVPTQN